MIINDKVIDIFCIIDEFDKDFEQEKKKNLLSIDDSENTATGKPSSRTVRL